VPPAWLLSRAARDVVSRAGFDFYELFAGIIQGAPRPDATVHGATVHAAPLRASRVIGWGSLNGVEAAATDAYARLQTLWPVTDTRVAVHPADMRRPAQRRSIAAALARLTSRARPQSYASYLGAQLI
jgi:hypothetical protein